MNNQVENKWKWRNWDISWSLSNNLSKNSETNILLIHGFGASKNHWRNNQKFLGNYYNCYAIDLLGFGESSQPGATLDYEFPKDNEVKYCFDLWAVSYTHLTLPTILLV